MRDKSFASEPRIAVVVSSDLRTDQRVDKHCRSLQQLGYPPILVGRASPAALPYPTSLSLPYPSTRINVRPERGPRMYAAFARGLYRWLLRQPLIGILANDLDTLPAAWAAACRKRIPLLYDSHEYFTGVPELLHRPSVRFVWQALEYLLLTRIPHRITVNQAIADRYEKDRGVSFVPVYNLPWSRSLLDQSKATPRVVLYQGALQEGRGLECLLQAWQRVTAPAQLWILGDGYHRKALQYLADKLPAPNPVRFWGAIPFSELPKWTQQGWLGLSLEDTRAPNSYLSSPNKVYDYLQARIPFLATDRPELRKILLSHPVGELLPTLSTEGIYNALQRLLTHPAAYEQMQRATEAASAVYCWEDQLPLLRKVYADAFGAPADNSYYHDSPAGTGLSW